ncbi:MAG: carboxypeptidase regulatory-like domain-containing protein, partial [Chloroflexia bacterium]
QLSALVRRLYLAATAVRPAVRVAVAAVAWGDGPDASGGWEQSQAYARVLQDWRGWLEEGILDLAAPRNFDREYRSDQRAWYDHWLEWEAGHLYGRGIVVLQGSYLNYPEHTLDQAQQALGVSKGVGFAYYLPANLYADPNGSASNPPRQPWYYSPEAEWWLWRMLSLPYGYTDPATGLFTGTTPLFPTPADPPEIPWKDTPALGHAWGRALGPDGQPLDGATVTLVQTPYGTPVRQLRTDGKGYFGAVDLAPGAYEARVEGAAPSYALQSATVRAGRVAFFLPSFPFRAFLPLTFRHP